jgi:hypothetical protein
VASPDGAVDMLEKMVLSIAWHAANTRKNFKEDAAVGQSISSQTSLQSYSTFDYFQHLRARMLWKCVRVQLFI